MAKLFAYIVEALETANQDTSEIDNPSPFLDDFAFGCGNSCATCAWNGIC